MSYYDHFERYTAGLGGDRTFNAVNVAELKLLSRGGEPTGVQDPRPFDGVEDLADLAPTGAFAPGAPLGPGSRAALDWDDQFLYLHLTTPAFADDGYAPWISYFQVDPVGAPRPSSGMEYSGLVPELPFEAQYAVSWRAVEDAGDGFGPWPALWVREGSGWRPLWRFQAGVDAIPASDGGGVTLVLSRAALGDPSTLRWCASVVWARPANEWKELAPATFTPWAGGGEGYLVDLSGPPDAAVWARE
jgi:hypothetical protein